MTKTIQARRMHTTRDVATLKQLAEAGQLAMASEFQRNAVWPRPAKAYLIDTIVTDRPIPYLYFRRSISAQTGRALYEVIDGQQRLRAIFEFLDNRFGLTETKSARLRGKRFDQLSEADRAAILAYDLYIEELTGYSDADVRDMFVRMNRFVVRLARQEIRHAEYKTNKFAKLVEDVAQWAFWKTQRVFTSHQIRRMRAVEFAAELVILLVEGPQDKKVAVDLYYERFRKKVPFAKDVQNRLGRYLSFIQRSLPEFRMMRLRKPTHFYSLVGALDDLAESGRALARLDADSIGSALRKFDLATRRTGATGRAGRYLSAASRQTDNLGPRLIRIRIFEQVIGGA